MKVIIFLALIIVILRKYFSSPPEVSNATVQHPFMPSADWQEIPEDIAVPPGGEYRLDLGPGGKRYGRWPKMNPEQYPIRESSTELNSLDQFPQQRSLEDQMRLATYPDINKPCFACGQMNWKLHNDGETYYCGTCHPTCQKEESDTCVHQKRKETNCDHIS